MTHLAVGLPVSDSVLRNAEYAECLRKNLNNPRIGKITLIVEECDLPSDDPRAGLTIHPKVNLLPLGRRAFFSDYLRALSQASDCNLKAFANADVYFDFTLGHLDGIELGGSVLTITRNDFLFDQNYLPAHDAWIFAETPKVTADFPLGYDKCDFGFLGVLEGAGYEVLNPSYSIHIVHVHKVPTKRSSDQQVHDAEWPHRINVCDIIRGKIVGRRVHLA